LTSDDVKLFIEQYAQTEEQMKMAKEEHKRVEDLFLGVIALLPIAVWVLENDGKIHIQNKKAQEIAIDFNTFDLEKNHDTEIEIDSKNYILQIAHFDDKVIISATDNTKTKQNERLLSMGKMAAHLAHEIRNPIGAVQVLTSTLFNRVDFKTKSIVLEIKKSVWRVERIVKATLLFSKGVTINPKEFFFEDLKEELDLITNNYSFSKDIEFIYSLPKVELKADYDLLGMVLQNLIINAIDAIEEDEDENENGTIEIMYDSNDNFHILKVYDSGKDFEDKKILFKAFKSTKTKGNGLGLTLSKQIIEAHKGNIELCDKRKGFIITLPF
jgi:two-component system NtrC family sensor kinase/two-component system sensor histidine kinase AtoS